MTPDDFRIRKIDGLIEEGRKIVKITPEKNSFNFPMPGEIAPIPFYNWCADVIQFLKENFESDFVYLHLFGQKVMDDSERTHPAEYHAYFGIDTLEKIKKYVEENPENKQNQRINPIAYIERICNNFHLVCRELRNRREDRSTVDVKDEYDAQDLFRSLLFLFFDDIRQEEWTPSYAGGSSRIDFLLKKEQIAIELKRTRLEGNESKRIGDELLIDIDRYKEPADCKILVLFVYDPEGRINNPVGLSSDLLKKNTSELEIKMFIRPTGR
jgi:hypothetical protein